MKGNLTYTILKTSALFILITGLMACKGRQVFPPQPVIEFVSLTPAEVKALSGSFEIELKYRDGDGDLGTSRSDEKNFFVIDNRTNLPDTARIFTYSLPDLSSGARNPSIQGVIKVKIPLALSSSFYYPFPLPEKEETDFTVYLVDRAGNKSNVIVTSKVSVLP
jgi:hypothetical protein